ncbi:unnamed protein product [Phytomonas sp. EM1]|nr:unnamed protein product [Phytomonas sp. EM1]|eukprot:CCW62571.1 unnamed protein product [Phytomonas sp. isolate EM1]
MHSATTVRPKGTSQQDLFLHDQIDKNTNMGNSGSAEHEPNGEYAKDVSDQQLGPFSLQSSPQSATETNKKMLNTSQARAASYREMSSDPGRAGSAGMGSTSHLGIGMSKHRVYSLKVSGANFHDVFLDKQRILMNKLKYEFVNN